MRTKLRELQKALEEKRSDIAEVLGEILEGKEPDIEEALESRHLRFRIPIKDAAVLNGTIIGYYDTLTTLIEYRTLDPNQMVKSADIEYTDDGFEVLVPPNEFFYLAQRAYVQPSITAVSLMHSLAADEKMAKVYEKRCDDFEGWMGLYQEVLDFATDLDKIVGDRWGEDVDFYEVTDHLALRIVDILFQGDPFPKASDLYQLTLI